MEPPTLLLATLYLSSLFSRSVQECKEEYWRQRPTHTACLPPNRDCTIKKKGVNATERELIVKVHNDYRSTVAKGQLKGFPAAVNMLQVSWGEELASVAQAKAEQCTDAKGSLIHDEYEDRFTNKFKDTGQNLGFRRSSAPLKRTDWPSNIKAWYGEYADYPPDRVQGFRPPSGRPTGHFTQVVWAVTRNVGCGYTDYTVAGATVMPYMQLYVCNYGDAGNTLTLPVYQTGEVCSSCPSGTACIKETGLCSSDDAKGQPQEENGSPHKVPDAPHEKSRKSGEVPDVPNEKRGKPGEVPDIPEDKPRKPGEVPGTLHKQPRKPEEVSGAPHEKSRKSGEVPDVPNEKSGKPGEVPDIPEDKPGKPGEVNGTLHKQPRKPEEVPNSPHDERGKPGELPEKPQPDVLHKRPKPPDEDREGHKGSPASARRSSEPNVVRLPCPATWSAVAVAHAALLRWHAALT